MIVCRITIFIFIDFALKTIFPNEIFEMVVILKMKVLSNLKKLGKNYSVVIIPHTNDNVKRISFKAPVVKLLAALLIFSTAAVFALVYGHQKEMEDSQPQANEISSEELQKQIKNLTEIINSQNESLSLSNTQLEHMNQENSNAKSKIEEFTKLYSDIADDYLKKTSRGSVSTKSSNNAIIDLSKLGNIVQQLNKDFNDNGDLTAQLLATNEKLEKYIDSIPTFVPARGPVTSPFGMRNHPIQKVRKIHEGVDISSSKGDPIFAAASGVVEFAGYSNGYGYNVKIDHQNGFRTIYGHSSKLLVKKGDIINKGQKIALVGSTGNSTGPHLHFEIRIGNTPVDPTEYVNLKSAD